MKLLLPILILAACQSSTGPDCRETLIALRVEVSDPSLGDVRGSAPCIHLIVVDTDDNVLFESKEPCCL